MPEKKTIQVYTAEGCPPCQDVKDALQSGNFAVVGIEGNVQVHEFSLNDDTIELPADFELDAIPSAYHGLAQCRIFINEDTKKVTFDCSERHGE